MSLDIFTLIHILISLSGLLSGLVVVGGWIAGRHYPKLTAFFLVMTAATSITGYFFPFQGFTPAFAVGALSLILLAFAFYAYYGAKRTGRWNKVYLFTALTALYLNFFVLVAQLFQKTPALKALAPTQTEPPFGIAQTLVLAIFIALGVAALRGLRTVR